MSKKKGRKEQKIEIQDVKNRIVIHDDKSRFFTRNMRYMLFFVSWVVGFFVIMLYAWK